MSDRTEPEHAQTPPAWTLRHAELQASGPAHELTLSFRRAGPPPETEALAFGPFLDSCRRQLEADEACQRYRSLAGKLERARREVAELERKKQRAGLDREDALEKLNGEKLAQKLAQADRAVAELAERIGTARRGIASLEELVSQARGTVERELCQVMTQAAGEAGVRLAERERQLREAIAARAAAEVAELAAVMHARSYLGSEGLRRKHLQAAGLPGLPGLEALPAVGVSPATPAALTAAPEEDDEAPQIIPRSR